MSKSLMMLIQPKCRVATLQAIRAGPPRRKSRPAGARALEGLAGRLDGVDAEAATLQAKLLTDIARLRLKELRPPPANPPPRKRV